MTVEFISAVNVNPGNELNRLGRADIDLPFFSRYVEALEDAGFDYTLCAYHSSFQDQFAIANQIVARTERVKPIVALRPNTIYPTVAAKALATLDQFSHDGEFYRFEGFVSAVRPVNGTIPVSVGGSSADAYRVGGSRGDIFG